MSADFESELPAPVPAPAPPAPHPAPAATARGISRGQLLACAAFLLAGLGMALWLGSLRLAADRNNKSVMVLVDWHALNALPESAEHARISSGARQLPWELLEQLPGAMLCYSEETVGDLIDAGVLRPARVRSVAPAYEVADIGYRDDVAKGANRHGYLTEVSTDTGQRLTLLLPDLPNEELMQLPVCWNDGVIRQARAKRIPLLLRPGGTEYLGEDGLAATLGFVREQPLVLFNGPQVLGHPWRLAETAALLAKQKQSFGWVEFDKQDGGAQLASKLAPGIVRIHSIPAEEMGNYTPFSATARLQRALRERNVRCLYLRPFNSGAAISDVSMYTNAEGRLVDHDYRYKIRQVNGMYFRAVKDMLDGNSYAITQSVAPPADPPAAARQIRLPLFALAKGGALVILLGLLLPGLRRWAFSALLILTALKALAVPFVPALMKFFPLEAAIVFPLLGIWVAMLLYQRIASDMLLHDPRRLWAALAALSAACAISAFGGLLIHAALWSARSMLHLDEFRGVTLALAVPVLLFAGYAWQAETLQAGFDRASLRLLDYAQRFGALWHAPIRYGDVAFIMIAALAAGVVLLRSGNDSSLGVLGAEAGLRTSLESLLSVRPRTKELLGHPLLVLFLLSLPWRTRLSLLLGLAALVGQVSILNTFCHLHTPLAITLERVGLGIGIGLLSGLFAGVLALVAGQVRERLGNGTSAPAVRPEG